MGLPIVLAIHGPSQREGMLEDGPVVLTVLHGLAMVVRLVGLELVCQREDRGGGVTHVGILGGRGPAL